eukprot:TRINITY_DN126161_c0_g1_i1.p1 TRINITY_DN126161_c0_g1~~TRINITY_DN126161_c0_g1_i1.p1  ORF type:complete len:476 (+),score=124.44 TRINITY_DN126161_c0_g1_i1:86-1513(+)
MQKADLDVAAELFEVASDGVDDDYWTHRFQEHIAQAMKRHSGQLRGQGGQNGSLEHQLEVLRARLELHDIVQDRLEARATRLDPSMAEALQMLRKANGSIVKDVLTLQRGGGMKAMNGGGGAGGPGGGVQAFAAAKRAQSPQRDASPVGSPSHGSLAEMDMGRGSVLPLQSSPRGYTSLHPARKDMSGRPAKELMLRQLRDIMQTVYSSKASHDQRCMELGEPLETLEQHLYAFLSKRYGLKSVVQEWSQAIFRTIQKYAAKEVDVLVFGKILQNSLSESFATVQDTLRSTVQTLLRNDLQARHKHRPQAEVDALWRARAKHGVPLSECEDVVRYMYNDRDSSVVLSRLHTTVTGNAAKEDRSGEPTVIRYADFVQILLTFQMQLTEGFLCEFVEVFRQIDTDKDGILTGAQLELLVRQLSNVEEADAEGLQALGEAEAAAASTMAPYLQATFSECVDLCTGLVSARWAALGHGR